MTFSTMSPAVVAAGAVLIAALLFALQRLRPRPRVVALASASLWAAAVHAAPRRVLTGRFARWPAYLLALAIALLLWLAAAAPDRREAADGRLHLFYLDTAAPMLAGNAFATARDAMLADAAGVPARDREVDLGAATPVRLLDRGEDMAVLRGRLATARAGAYPSTFTAWLASIASRPASARPVMVHYYGRAAGAPVPRLPPNVALVIGYSPPPLTANRGIVALGVSPAKSGAEGRADVLIRTMDARGSAPGIAALRFTLDSRSFAPRGTSDDGAGSIVLRDVPATGSVLRVVFARGDAFAADDAAAIVVPDRRPVRVALALGIPDTIARVAALDPALRLVDVDRAQVVVRRAGQAFGLDRPALVLADVDRQSAALAITDPDGQDDATLVRDIEALSIARIDAGALAEDVRLPIGITVATGPRRTVSAWTPMFAAGTSFAQSRAMPLFVSRSLRWLARPAPWISYARAGMPLSDQSALYGIGGDADLARRGLGGDVVAAEAGERRIGGRTVAVALGSAAVTRSVVAADAAASVPWQRSPAFLVSALLLLALLLLALEWHLFLRRRIA